MEYDNLFHVHTKRCGHAGNETDADYIQTALELNAKSIYFTDHAPFPENVFGNRMKMAELDEYVNTLAELKERYNHKIDIKVGLEIEYLPKYKTYYCWLKEKYGIDLFLGQHICTHNGNYNFAYKDKSEEYEWLAESILEGLDTGFFSALLHPERIYKNSQSWGEQQILTAKAIWEATQDKNIPIEYNYSSVVNPKIKYWHSNFWAYKTHNNIIYGLDAHNTKDLRMGTDFFRVVSEA